MKNIFLFFTFITALSQVFAKDIVIFDAKNNINIPRGKHIINNPNSIELKSNKKVVFKGEWNLSNHLDFEVEIENMSKERGIDFRLFIFDDNNIKMSTYYQAFVGTRVPAMTTQKSIISFPTLPAKNLLDKMRGMRADPFGFSAICVPPTDLTKIKTIEIMSAWTSAEPHFKIKKIVAKNSSKRKNPDYWTMSDEQFFPFIDKYGQFKFKEWQGKIHSDEDLKNAIAKEEKDLADNPSPKNRNEFGGFENGKKFDATGHFYVKKIDGKWWLIDPTGSLFWSHGVVRVTPSSAITPLDNREFYFENLPTPKDEFAQFYETKDELLYPYYVKRGIKKTYDFSAANIYRKYGKNWREKYADISHRRLKSWGLNTIANSSDSSIFMMRRTPYIDRFELKPPEVPALKGAEGQWWPFPDVFSKEFEMSIENNLLKRKDQLNDPWCLGFFVDNEIHWGSPITIARNALVTPESATKKVFVERLKSKYVDIENLNKAWKTSYKTWDAFLVAKEAPNDALKDDLLEFNREITETYFKKIRDGIKKLAPHKLYMGCRFSGSNKPLVKIGAKYCDVISYNTYRDDLKWLKLPEGVDKPIMIGEFHFGGMDRGPFHSSLIHRASQKERAQSYYDYVYSALKHPNLIGTHWHQFSDQATTGRFDGENFQVGFTDVADNPYPETIEKIREIGYKLYEIRLEK